MSTVATPPTCESGTHTCESDQRPGPHIGSDSFTANDTAAHDVDDRPLAFPANSAKLRPAVPSKRVGPVSDTEGVGDCV
jgi:hypothetical protein